MQGAGRRLDEGPLGVECQEASGVVESDPADALELVIVTVQVTADRLHEKVVDGLVDARAALDEGVLDGRQRRDDPDPEARLLLDLADGRLLE